MTNRSLTAERPCTCHPDERFVPCREKYAFSECQKEDELERAVARCQRRIDRAEKPKQQAKWDRGLGMYMTDEDRYGE